MVSTKVKKACFCATCNGHLLSLIDWLSHQTPSENHPLPEVTIPPISSNPSPLAPQHLLQELPYSDVLVGEVNPSRNEKREKAWMKREEKRDRNHRTELAAASLRYSLRKSEEIMLVLQAVKSYGELDALRSQLELLYVDMRSVTRRTKGLDSLRDILFQKLKSLEEMALTVQDKLGERQGPIMCTIRKFVLIDLKFVANNTQVRNE